MNPIIIWYVIAGVVVITFFMSLLRYLRFHYHFQWHSVMRRLSHGAVEISRERDIIYAPGDNKYDDEEESNIEI